MTVSSLSTLTKLKGIMWYPIPLLKKYKALSDQNNDSSNIEVFNPSEDTSVSNIATSTTQNQNTSILHRDKRKIERIAGTIKKLNEYNPFIKMKSEFLEIHWKTDADFRITQTYLDTNTIAYTALSPADQPPRKIVQPCTYNTSS